MQFCMFDAKSFHSNMLVKKVRFLLGDHWIDVGDIVTGKDKNSLEIIYPDINEFLAKRQYLDDGTFDWANWGPRVN